MKTTFSLYKKATAFSFMPWALCGLMFLLMAALPTPADAAQTAVVATIASDYSSSAVAIAPVDAVDGAYTVQDGLLDQTNSDITVSSYGRYFYLITKYGANTVAKVDIDAPETPVWQFSTEGEEEESNPYELVFVNSEKAYLIRYGSSTAWIVNPSAETEEDFKIGELDLSAYDEGDGTPEMAGAVVAQGKLFVMMQRLNWWAPNEAKPYVAVFDVETDTEIDTAMGEGGLMGVPLDIKNPLAIQYLEENDTVYVQGIGAYPDGYFTYPDYEDDGGIVAIDVYDYSATLVLDDGDGDNLPYGQIAGMAMVSSTKGYFIGYDDGEHTTLYSFDPSSENPAGVAVEGLVDKTISGLESGSYADENGMLWVCNQTDVRIEILDTATDTIDESIETVLNPSKVVFTEEEDQGDGDSSVGTDSDSSSTCFISDISGDTAKASSGVLLLLVMLGGALPALRRSRK